MKKLKLLGVTLLASALTIVLPGCDNPEPPHEHTFATEWSSDENGHWHVATCEHTEERSGEGAHIDTNFDGKCDACQYELDKGFDEDLYSKGYTYLKNSYPTDQIKSFIGNGVVNVLAPDSSVFSTNGTYYKSFPETSENYAYFDVIFAECTVDSDFEAFEELYYSIYDLFDEPGDKYFAFYDSYFYGNFVLDQEGTYIASMIDEYNDDYTVSYLGISFMKLNDVINGSKTKTSSANWSNDESTFINENFGGTIPFPQLGADIDIACILDEEGAFIQAYDNSPNYSLGLEYKQKLLDAGFTYQEEDFVYTKPVNSYQSIVVSVSYTLVGGNLVEIYLDSTVLSSFPTEFMNDYVTNVCKSKYSVYPFTASARTYDEGFTRNAQYRASIEADGSARVSGLFMDLATFRAYAQQYIDDGYTVVDHDEYKLEDGYVDTYESYILDKGKIRVTLVHWPEEAFDMDTYEFTINPDNGTCELLVTPVEALEEKGLLIKGGDVEVTTLVESFELELLTLDLGDNPTITFSSNKTDVVTVDAEGTVTVIGAGEATLTATYVDASGTYTSSIKVTVTQPATKEVIVFADANLADKPTSYTSQGGVKFTFAKGANGKSDPAYNSNYEELRLYAFNEMSITAPEGHTITGIEFSEASSYGDKTQASVFADKGEYEDLVWLGEENSVTFSLGSIGQFRILSVTVYLDGTPTDIGSNTPGEENFLQEIMVDILVTLFGDYEYESDEDYFYDSDSDSYYTCFSLEGFEGESDLKNIIEYIDGYLGDYYDALSPVQEYEYEDLAGWEIYYTDATEEAEINVYSFIEDGDLLVVIDVYSADY